MLSDFNAKFNYEQIIDYLFNKLSNFSTTGKIKKYDLSNISTFSNKLNNPHLKYKTIHIAGTNGKGSVSSIIASILSTAGYKVGLYTSPHLYDFRERIRINGKKITKSYIVSFVQDTIRTISILKLSFFEVTVAMAFKYFADNEIDIGVIETGLGGEFDSTNIVNPMLSIITNVSHDHKQYLGNTLESIAKAKSGIIKYKTPIVIGKYNKRFCEVFEKKALQKQSALYYANNFYQLKFVDKNKLKIIKPIKSKQHFINTDLNGWYQSENIATALKSIDVLNANYQLGITDKTIKKALLNVKNLSGLMARWQIVQNNPKIILDVAHNIAGIRQILKQIKNEKYNNLFFIINMMKDKNIGSIVKILPKEASYYFPAIDYKRASSEADFYKKAIENDLKATCCSNLQEALTKAKNLAKTTDLIVICGSFFLIKDYKLLL